MFGWVRLPLACGEEKSHLQHLESCTGVWVVKTFPLLIGSKKSFAISSVMQWNFGG